MLNKFSHTLYILVSISLHENLKTVKMKCWQFYFLKNYIIPYNAHNDFLEAFAETGLVGGFFFLLFFLLTPYYLYRIFQNKSSNRPNEIYFAILTLPFLVYFVDLNLNFPSSRPSNQIIFLFYLTIVLITHSKIYAKK